MIAVVGAALALVVVNPSPPTVLFLAVALYGLHRPEVA